MRDFYVRLGFELRREDIEEREMVGTFLDTPGIRLRTSKLIIENSEIPISFRFNLEIMEVISR
jgi:hypothetical protein